MNYRKGLYKRNNSPHWWMRFTANGKLYRISTETDNLKSAEKIFNKIKTDIAEGKWLEKNKAMEHTFDEMMERFIDEHLPKLEKSTQARYMQHFKYLTKFFTGKTLAQIDTDEILRYFAVRKQCGPATRNRERNALSKMFNLARLWKWTKENPCQLIPGEKENNEDIGRELTREEETRLLPIAREYLNGQMEEIVIVGIETGMRKGSILRYFFWEKIDLFNRKLQAFNEKTNKWYTIPMTQRVYDLLKTKAKTSDMQGNVFKTSNETHIGQRNLIREWHKALKRADIKGFRFHDLRHTCGRRLVDAGVDLWSIAAILDHSQISTTMRYARHSVGSKKNAIEKLDNFNNNCLKKAQNE